MASSSPRRMSVAEPEAALRDYIQQFNWPDQPEMARPAAIEQLQLDPSARMVEALLARGMNLHTVLDLCVNRCLELFHVDHCLVALCLRR